MEGDAQPKTESDWKNLDQEISNEIIRRLELGEPVSDIARAVGVKPRAVDLRRKRLQSEGKYERREWGSNPKKQKIDQSSYPRTYSSLSF